MIKLLGLYILAAILVILVDRKVMRDIPGINRWMAYILLAGGFGIWAYCLQFGHVVYGSVLAGHYLDKFVPF